MALCERLIELLRAGTPLDEALSALNAMVCALLGDARRFPEVLLRKDGPLNQLFLYHPTLLWKDFRIPGTWVPFAVLDTAEGFLPQQRLGILRRMLEAGVPADFCVPLTNDRNADEVSLLSVAFAAGLPEEARLLFSFGARMATSWAGRDLSGRCTLQKDLFRNCAKDDGRIRLALEMDFQPNHGALRLAVERHMPLDIVCTIIKLGDCETGVFSDAVSSLEGVNMEVLMHLTFDPVAQEYFRGANAGDTVGAALRATLRAHNFDVVRVLLDNAERLGRSEWKSDEELLTVAIATGDVRIVHFLLAYGIATRYLSMPENAFEEHMVYLLEYLLDLGVPVPDVMAEPIGGFSIPNLSPIAYAASRGHARVLRALIRHGVHKRQSQVWISVSGKRTHALHLAASARYYDEKERIACVWELLDGGFDPDILDQDHRSALHYAAERNAAEIVRLLISAGATLVRDAKGRTPLDDAPRGSASERTIRALYPSALVKIP